MTIRPADARDADALGRIHVRAWQAAYRGVMPDDYLDGLSREERAGQWREPLARPARPKFARYICVDDAGGDAGFIVAGPPGGDDAAAAGEVFALNVDPQAWGCGHGGRLLARATEHLREVGLAEAVLWVHPDNDRARRFYERAGWACAGDTRAEVVHAIEVPEIRYTRRL